jgi:hypothetical protein
LVVGSEASACGRGLLPSVDEYSLLPSARRLVGSVDATRPAARPPLSFQQLVTGSRDTPLPGRDLLGIIDPADELVSAKRRQSFPQRQYALVRLQSGLKVFRGLVHGAMEKSVSQRNSTRVYQTDFANAEYGAIGA